MEKLVIICVDDQRDVLSAIRNDLEPLSSAFGIRECESAAEARELMEEVDAAGGHVALLVCDHVMPGGTGVDFLTRVAGDRRFRHTRKILLTGLATHQDTIQAINRAGIDAYVEKPWDAGELVALARRLVTSYVVDSGLEYRDFLGDLDQQVLYEALRRRT